MKKLIILAVGLGSASAHANGFLLNEFDARAVGRGNSVTATDTDPSSIYYNIGGLAVNEGVNVEVGGSLIAPFATYNDPQGNKFNSDTDPQVVPAIFASSRVHELVAIGVGFYTPFGLALGWPDNTPTNDVAKDVTLHTFFITPSVGVNLGSYVPGLTLGGGVDVVPATVELTQQIFFGDVTGNAHVGANGTGVGGRVGAMYIPKSLPQLSVGVMWRSNVKIDFSGKVDFDAPTPFRAALPLDGPASTSLTLPQQVTVGAAYRPTDVSEVEANVIWTNWSVFKTIDLDVPSMTGMGTTTISQPQEWENTWSARVGGEYHLVPVGVGLRAGFIFDPTPVKPQFLTATLPDVDRYDLTLGASKSFGNYAVHLGLLWVLPTNRKISDDLYMPIHKGSYDVSAFVASLTLQASFGTVGTPAVTNTGTKVE